MWQNVAAGVLVALAVVLLVRHVYRLVTGRGASACGRCGGSGNTCPLGDKPKDRPGNP